MEIAENYFILIDTLERFENDKCEIAREYKLLNSLTFAKVPVNIKLYLGERL